MTADAGGPAVPVAPPLARLFAIAYQSMIEALHVELRARGWVDVRPAFGFVLLAARDGPTTSTALARLFGTSKQATSKLIDAITEAGYVQRTGADDGRRRPVELTPRGADLLYAVEEIYAAIETEWAGIIGRGSVERLRGDLVTVLSTTNDGQLPAVRPPASAGTGGV